MLVGGIAITFTALLYPRHIIRYPELTLLKVKRCGKVEMFSDVTLPLVNILHHFLTL
jgi:hypothetical protein